MWTVNPARYGEIAILTFIFIFSNTAQLIKIMNREKNGTWGAWVEHNGPSRVIWRILFNVEHLGYHDYMSLNEKPFMNYEYVYHVGVLLKFC